MATRTRNGLAVGCMALLAAAAVPPAPAQELRPYQPPVQHYPPAQQYRPAEPHPPEPVPTREPSLQDQFRRDLERLTSREELQRLADRLERSRRDALEGRRYEEARRYDRLIDVLRERGVTPAPP